MRQKHVFLRGQRNICCFLTQFSENFTDKPYSQCNFSSHMIDNCSDFLFNILKYVLKCKWCVLYTMYKYTVQYNSTGICTVCILSQFLYSSNSTVYEYEMV